MRYMGGKARIGKHIVAAMSADIIHANRFIEPFVGGFNIVPHLHGFNGSVECYDANAALVWLYRALIGGWNPPTNVTREQYQTAKELPDSDPMKAFCGFGCSFAGKWFGGYATSGERNYARNCANSLNRKRVSLNRVDLLEVRDYRDCPVGGGDVVYCDPPYAGTTTYSAVCGFDSAAFWEWCSDAARGGSVVYVSEYACPITSEVVWERPQTTTVSRDKSKYRGVTEKLFRIAT